MRLLNVSKAPTQEAMMKSAITQSKRYHTRKKTSFAKKPGAYQEAIAKKAREIYNEWLDERKASRKKVDNVTKKWRRKTIASFRKMLEGTTRPKKAAPKKKVKKPSKRKEPGKAKVRKSTKKGSGVKADSLDVFRIAKDHGMQGLRSYLEQLDTDVLKNIISQHSFDVGGQSRRWKKRERLIDLILEMTEARMRKGEAFFFGEEEEEIKPRAQKKKTAKKPQVEEFDLASWYDRPSGIGAMEPFSATYKSKKDFREKVAKVLNSRFSRVEEIMLLAALGIAAYAKKFSKKPIDLTETANFYLDLFPEKKDEPRFYRGGLNKKVLKNIGLISHETYELANKDWPKYIKLLRQIVKKIERGEFQQFMQSKRVANALVRAVNPESQSWKDDLTLKNGIPLFLGQVGVATFGYAAAGAIGYGLHQLVAKNKASKPSPFYSIAGFGLTALGSVLLLDESRFSRTPILGGGIRMAVDIADQWLIPKQQPTLRTIMGLPL